MDITLRLSTESQTELEKRAAAAGTDVAGYIRSLVEQQLESDGNAPAQTPLPYEQWRREFRAWLASQPSRIPAFDDSRDSIYD